MEDKREDDNGLQPLAMTPGGDPQAVPQARLIVVEIVYHQNPDEQPSRVENRWVRQLKSQEQLFRREVTIVGSEWQPLDEGWVEKVGHLVVVNKEGRFFQVMPSDEQRQAADKLIVELGMVTERPGFVMPFAVVRPRESSRFEPAYQSLHCLRIHAPNGPAKCSIIVYPA